MGQHCDGTLLVHHDGTAAACSEELEGRCCPGPAAVHGGGSATCDEVLGGGGCELCAADSWGEREWRHATHLGQCRRTARQCSVHRPRQVVLSRAR